jgi:hypothetical protein
VAEAPSHRAERGVRETAYYLDSRGSPTDDPAQAVRGEIVEYDERGRPVKRTWFFLDQVEIEWLPVGERAFLLWVLVFLVVVWFAIGVAIKVF